MKRRRWPLLLCGAILSVLAAGPALAQPRVTSDELLDRIDSAQSLAELGGAEPSRHRMDEVRVRLDLPLEVAVGEWLVTIPPDPVLERLAGETAADFERAQGRLAVLERSLRDAIAREVPTRDEVATALSRAYSGLSVSRPNLLDLVLRAIADVLGALLRRLGSLIGGGSIIGWAVLAALAVAAVLLWRRLRLVPDRTLGSVDAARGAVGSVDWAAQAEQAIRAGDLRQAVRTLYLALLANLAGRGLVADAPALTAGEARAAVLRSRPALAPIVERATESYERVVYGGSAPSERDVEELRVAAARARTA